MESSWRTPGGRRLFGLVSVTFAVALLIGWFAPPAYSQVSNLPELPEVPELPLPSPPDELPLPDPDDLPLPDDVPVPDPGELPVPDPGELPVPDPGELPVPDPDVDPGNGPGRHTDRPKARRANENSGPGRRQSGLDGSPADVLAPAAVAGGGSSAPPDSKSPSAAASEADRRGIVDALAPFAFPLILLMAVAAFLALQGYFDRRDPKLAVGAVHRRDRLLTFD